jgi:RimJ/RimL family protein N-acetyltransferase
VIGYTNETGDGLVTLRSVDVADAELIFEAWGKYPENFGYLTARAFSTLADAREYVAGLFPTPDSRAFHIIATDQRVVGIVKVAMAGHRAQIGYVVNKPFWGRGFATEAVRQVVSLVEAQPRVSRVWATCAIENPASARVLEKCGFEREALLRNWVVYPAQGDRAFDNYSYVKVPNHAG